MPRLQRYNSVKGMECIIITLAIIIDQMDLSSIYCTAFQHRFIKQAGTKKGINEILLHSVYSFSSCRLAK